MEQQGKVYGIGVGPGDSDYITVKAVKLLGELDVVFSASSTRNDFSLALEIARPHLPENAEIRDLAFPMTRNSAVMEDAWENNAAIIAGEASRGKRVAFLTLGDPLIYSTFGYVLQKLQGNYPDVEVEVVPGITSYQAAAARTNRVLVEGEESLLLTSGVYGGENIRKLDGKVENVVLLKAYKNLGGIADVLEEQKMLERATAVVRCSREDEFITGDLRGLAEQKPDYWTLVMAKKEGES